MTTRLPARFLGGLVALLLAVAPLAGSTAMLMRSVQIDDDGYESPQFGYVVTWDDQWAGLDRHVVSEDGDRDEMMLSNNDGRLWVIGYPDDVDPSDALMATIDRFSGTASEVVITGMDNSATVPFAELTADRDHLMFEVQSVENATVAVVLLARDDDFSSALAAAQSGVTLNDGTVFVHEPVPAVAEGVDATEEPEATEEPTEEPGATEEPTEQPTEEPTEEPEATEEPRETEVPTEEPVDSGEVWESEQFGVSLDLPAGWTYGGEGTAENTADTLTISNGTSTIFLYLTFQYDGELDGCVAFARDIAEGIVDGSDLRLQATADGKPYQGSDDRSAYGLFSYTSSDGEAMAMYLHCQYIVEGESVLILMQDVPQADYQAQRSARATVLNAIDLP